MKRLVTALALALLAACKPSGLPYRLRPASTGPRAFATQDVRFQLPGGETQHLFTTLENDGRRLTIVLSTSVGMTLAVLTVTDGRLQVDARVPLPDSFDPRLLPTVIQLCDWPLEEARKGLKYGMTLDEEGSRRILRRHGEDLLVLDREGAAPPYRRITFRVPRHGVEAVITTLDDQP